MLMAGKATFYAVAVFSGILAAVAGNMLYFNIAFSETHGAKFYFFYSDYCPHCDEVKPYVEEFAKDHNLTWCNVAELDANCSQIVEKLGIKYVPTLVVMNGETHIFTGSSEVMRALKGLK